MDKRKRQAELEDIIGQMEELRDQARDIVRELDRDMYDQAKAYDGFNVISSVNPYDITLAKMFEDLVSKIQ